MKTKIIVLLIIFSAVTLSFSFGNRAKIDKNLNKAEKQDLRHEPSGGFVMEDKL